MNDTPNAAPQPEQDMPLNSWKFVSTVIISSASVMLCLKSDVGNLYSILLFFPIFKITAAVVNNDSTRVISGICTLLQFSILTANEAAIMSGVHKIFTSPKITEDGYSILYGISFTVLFFFTMMISGLAAKTVPVFKVPARIHKVVMIIFFTLTWVMIVIALFLGISYCCSHFITLPQAMKFLLPLILLAIGFGGFCKMFNAINTEKTSAPEADKNQLDERPSTRLADVAGMEEVKRQIKLRLIEPVKNPKLAEKYGLKAGGGVLLYGPPGTGKTFIARAVAGELNLPFYMITSADVFGKYVGESEKNIQTLFDNARKNPLSVVFIDELEVIFGKRTESIHETTQKVISVILQELDGVSQNKNPMLLLGATNTPWKVDEAFLRPGRFDILAFVDLPDLEARKQILKSAFKKGNLPLQNGLIDYIAENSNRLSGADLNGVVTKMRQNAFERKKEMFTMQMAYEILLDTTPSSTGELLRQIRQWEKERGI